MTYDVVVVGAGPTGATLAECAARVLDAKVLVVDRRSHVAGNCHDSTFPGTELLVHTYGPHYLRFKDRAIMDYAGRFTEWLPGNYIVRSSVDGQLVPVPINLETLELLFGEAPLDEESGAALLERERVPIQSPQNSEEYVLSRVGRRLYELLYRDYTRKQWGREASELDPSVCGRIPIRLNRETRYVDATYQVMPRDGYTAMFTRMLSHPNIDIATDVDWLGDRVYGASLTFFTGPIDDYFGHVYGGLAWRSLTFEWEVHDREWFQPCVQVNFPGNEPYTRRVEIKHVTRQRSSRTVVSTEYPAEVGEPYYPVPTQQNARLYRRYSSLAAAESQRNGVHFAGRLARYTYINTDEAISAALDAFAAATGTRPVGDAVAVR